MRLAVNSDVQVKPAAASCHHEDTRWSMFIQNYKNDDGYTQRRCLEKGHATKDFGGKLVCRAAMQWTRMGIRLCLLWQQK